MVEDLFKKREPALNAAGIYFLTPCEASVQAVVQEWHMAPTYGSAHIFFTNQLPPELMVQVKSCTSLVARLRTLAEARPGPRSTVARRSTLLLGPRLPSL